MKIVCESCGTKYSIADEKVSGKVFKLRCKKCSHVIVVRGTTESEAAHQEAPGAAASGPAPEQAGSTGSASDAVWHLVIDREQVGPMTAAEVRQKFASGVIDSETYIWREGFDDWLKLSSVEEFQDLGGAQRTNGQDQPTRRSDKADLFRDAGRDEAAAPGADLFHPPVTSSPTAATILGTSPVSSAPSRPHQPPGDLMGASSGPSPSVDIRPLTGARSENSVLFSLNNLQALASGSASGSSGGMSGGRPGYADSRTEGSGLIDIRAMAAQTLSASNTPFGMASSKPDDLPMVSEAPLFSPVAPAMLMPISEPPSMPKWVWAVVGVGGVMFLGMTALIIWVVRSSPPPAPAPQPTVAVASPPAGIQQPGVAPTAQPASPAAASSEPTPGKPSGKEEVAAGDAERKRRAREGRDKERDRPPAARDREPAAPTTPVAPTPEPSAERRSPKPKPKDDLDALLDSATGGASAGRPKVESVRKDAPEQLGMDEIKSVLKGVNASVQSCSQGSPGTFIVKMTIGRNGRVSDAFVPGKAGDATAECVVRAVKAARFPEFSGDPQSLSYPFILR